MKIFLTISFMFFGLKAFAMPEVPCVSVAEVEGNIITFEMVADGQKIKFKRQVFKNLDIGTTIVSMRTDSQTPSTTVLDLANTAKKENKLLCFYTKYVEVGNILLDSYISFAYIQR